MIFQVAKVGQGVMAVRDIPLTRNTHVIVQSSAAPAVLRKGTKAEVIAVAQQYIDVVCNDGHGSGPESWGLKLRVAKIVWGTSFE